MTAPNFLKRLCDPAQSYNSISIGGYTTKDIIPNTENYKNFKALAPKHGISPHTRSGKAKDVNLPIKPEVVFEAGNFAVDDLHFGDTYTSTLASLTCSHDMVKHPYVISGGTSVSTALASKFLIDIWNTDSTLKPESIRGLLVHSASWTSEMKKQISGKDDLLALCGYGVPSLELATYCTKNRATVIIEDSLSNYSDLGNGKPERPLKLFRLPLPKDILLKSQNKEVELRVTLSYFAEPNSSKGIASQGMNLSWDIQGPAETDKEFEKRINKAMREEESKKKGPGTKSFNWDIGYQRRSKGTVQSDRWRGNAADLAGDKMIAVYPKYGWWNQRKELKDKSMSFSLIVTVHTPGIEIYNHVKLGISNKVPANKIVLKVKP